jgi:hypothetical protein
MFGRRVLFAACMICGGGGAFGQSVQSPANFASPPPLGNITPNTVAATSMSVSTGSPNIGIDLNAVGYGTAGIYVHASGTAGPVAVNSTGTYTTCFWCDSSTAPYGMYMSGSYSSFAIYANGMIWTTQGIKFTNLAFSNTAPTISSGFGVGPLVVNNNGTSAFRINVGTGGTATSGVVGLPAAATGWNCMATDITTQSSTVFITKQTASTTTTATLKNYNTAGALAAWVASDILAVNCVAF